MAHMQSTHERRCKKAWITQKAMERLEGRRTLKPKDLMDDLQKNMVVEANPQAVRKATAQARTEINEEEASFDKLPGFFEALKEANPGTVAEIEMEYGHF